MKADTSHISTCRRHWFEHLQTCESCYKARMWSQGPACEVGKALQDEYIQAHYANRDLEEVTATEADNESNEQR